MGRAFVIGNLMFTETERLFVIRRRDRKDIPHLTISFENASGEIDLHFKHESPQNDASSTYTPIIRFPKAALVKFLANYFSLIKWQEILGTLFSNMKKVRPGWLERKGYIIALGQAEMIESILSPNVIAPKRRGKHRVDVQKLKDFLNEPDLSEISFYYPSVLHILAAQGYNKQVAAIRVKGKRRVILLQYIPWRNGKGAWLTLDRVPTNIQEVFSNNIPSTIKDQVKDIWYRIFDTMMLNEIGLKRDL